MLRLLLDHHISPDVVEAARKHSAGVSVQHVQDLGWQRHPDPVVLGLAHQERLTLVTYDLATIPQYLREFAERQQPHSGVVLVDGPPLPARNRGGIGRALAK